LRECREELGWAPQSLKYLASFPNTYRFRNVEYWTCDLFFCSDIAEYDLNLLSPHAEESTELLLAKFNEIPWDAIAFDSTRQALKHYLSQQ